MLLQSTSMNFENLRELVEENVSALLVKRFIDNGIARKLTEKILGNGYHHYINAPSIGRIGMAFYEAERNSDLIGQYFEQSSINIDDLRDRCTPLLSPIDLLRCRLDEVWPAGAKLETLYGQKMYVGLSRVVEPGVAFLAHHDIFAKDAPDSFRAHCLQSQIACNVYLSMPSEGGGLQIWDRAIPAEEFDAMRQDCYGVDPEILGEPQLVIEPEPGDLVLFNSRLMHAVLPGEDVPRLSLSCFVGYRGPATPLTFWS